MARIITKKDYKFRDLLQHHAYFMEKARYCLQQERKKSQKNLTFAKKLEGKQLQLFA